MPEQFNFSGLSREGEKQAVSTRSSFNTMGLDTGMSPVSGQRPTIQAQPTGSHVLDFGKGLLGQSGQMIQEASSRLGSGIGTALGHASRILPGDQSGNPERFSQRLAGNVPDFIPPQTAGGKIGGGFGSVFGFAAGEIPSLFAGGLAAKGVGAGLKVANIFQKGRLGAALSGAAQGVGAIQAEQLTREVKPAGVDLSTFAGGVGLVSPSVAAGINKLISLRGAKKTGDAAKKQIESFSKQTNLPINQTRRIAGKEKLFNEYKKVVDKSILDDRAPDPIGFFEKKFQKGIIHNMQDKRSQVGKQLRQSKELVYRLNPAELKVIENEIMERAKGYNLKLVDGKFIKIPDLVEKINDSGTKVVQNAYDQLQRVRLKPTSSQLLDFRDNIDRGIDAYKLSVDPTGKVSASKNLDVFGKGIRGVAKKINMNRVGPSDAALYDRYTLLSDVLNPHKRAYTSTGVQKMSQILRADGSAESAIKKIITGDTEVKSVLKDVGNVLGIDILDYTLDNATMAKVVTEVFGDQRAAGSASRLFSGTSLASAALTKGTSLIPDATRGFFNFITRKTPEKELQKILKLPAMTKLRTKLNIFEGVKINKKKFNRDLKEFRENLEKVNRRIETQQEMLLQKIRFQEELEENMKRLKALTSFKNQLRGFTDQLLLPPGTGAGTDIVNVSPIRVPINPTRTEIPGQKIVPAGKTPPIKPTLPVKRK